jgi:hypothetical protein
VKDQVDVIIKALRRYMMKENKDVVDAVGRCLESVKKVDRRMDDLENRMGAPNCPMCGRKR